MGMDLVPVYADEIGGSESVTGRATVTIEPRRLRQLGVRTTPAAITDAAVRTIRTVGFVRPDEERIVHVHTRASGWIDSVRVRTEGDPVTRGQVLYELYSPDLVATQEELLAALRQGNSRAAEAARQRLRYWDVAPRDIAAIEAKGKVRRALPFRSPISGFIESVRAVEGMHVGEMTDLYVLMDLDRIWVLGQFYETDLPLLSEGAPAEVDMPSGETLAGTVDYIYPSVDPRTRFARVRIAFDNEELRLRPGMYVEVAYRAELGPGLVVPRDAVMRTGTRALAFVHLGGGRFEPRELDLGPATDEGYIVYGGLEHAEPVADQATFFIDSESSLKAALTQYKGGGAGGHDH